MRSKAWLPTRCMRAGRSLRSASSALPPPTIYRCRSERCSLVVAKACRKSKTPFDSTRLPTHRIMRPSSGRPSSRRAANRSRGRKCSRSTPFMMRWIRLRSTPSATTASARAELTAMRAAAFGRRAFIMRRGPGSFDPMFTSLPCSLTTAGTPRSLARAMAAQPSGWAQEPSTTSTLLR